MEKVFTAIGYVVSMVGLVVLLSFLFAFPTKWLVNYLFSSVALTWIFGVTKITVWQGLWINVLSSTLFKSSRSGK